MNQLVTIIDPDDRFARMMSGRLKLYLPGIQISACSGFSGNPCRDNQVDLITQADIIMYDNQKISPKHLTESKTDLPSTHLIPLRQPENDARISASQAFRQIQSLLNESANQYNAYDQDDRNHTRGKLIFFLCFCDAKDRELYIKENTSILSEYAHPVYRIDLMPGIKINTIKPSNRHDLPKLSSSGMNQFLSSPHILKNDEIDIMSYCQPDANGHYTLGRPIRSDDIINTDIDDIEKMISLIRKRIERTDSNSCAITVIDGFSFLSLKKLCPLAHEIHVILSDDQQYQDPLFKFEIDQLLSNLSPLQKHFIQSAERKLS